MLEQSCREEAGHYPAAGDGRAILPLSDLAHQQRPMLDVARPASAERFVAAQRELGRLVAGNTFCEYERILKGHAAALTKIRRAWMRRVPEQSHAPVRPARQGRKIVGSVFEDQLRGFDQGGDRLMSSGEALQELAFPLAGKGRMGSVGRRVPCESVLP